MLLNSQTLYHINELSAADGHPEDIGRTVDKLVRSYMLYLKRTK